MMVEKSRRPLMKLKKKHPMTLLEIMIVIFIIGIIGSVIGYNMKGSLEEGKAFKSKEGARQIYEVLTLEMAKGLTMEDVTSKTEEILKSSGMIKSAEDLLKDGWGVKYDIKATQSGDDIRIISGPYMNYLTKKNRKKQIPFWMDEKK